MSLTVNDHVDTSAPLDSPRLVATWMVNREGTVVHGQGDTIDGFCGIPTTLVGRSVSDAFESHQTVVDAVDKAMTDQGVHVAKIELDTDWCEVHVRPMPNESGVLISFYDMVDRSPFAGTHAAGNRSRLDLETELELKRQLDWLRDANVRLSGDLMVRKQVEGILRRGQQAERDLNTQLTVLQEVSVTLSGADNFDELCKQAVVLGRDQFGFSRISFRFVDGDINHFSGSFGTDESGELRDERECHYVGNPITDLDREVWGDRNTTYKVDMELTDHHGKVVGLGEQAIAPMYDNDDLIGVVICDNLLCRQHISDTRRKLLFSYASVVAHVSARCRVEMAQRQHMARLKETVDATPVPMFVVRQSDHAVLYSNIELQQVFGEDPTPVIKLCIAELLENQPTADDNAAHQFQTQELRQHEINLAKYLDRTQWASVSARPLVFGTEAAWIFGCIDITDRIAAEQASRKHQEELTNVIRQSTVGEMASNLAHELSHPISSILLYASAAVRKFESGSTGTDELVEAIERITTQARRGRDIIRRLQDFVCRQRISKSRISLNDLMQNVVELLDVEITDSGTDVVMELDPSAPDVAADRIQIEQVLFNLVRNAIQAMGNQWAGERKLTLCIAVSQSDPRQVETVVRDTGPGMKDEVAERVFLPFFSTKAKGLGLGLAICAGIIEAHSGKLSLDRNAPPGATFRFTLPAYDLP